MSDDKLTSHDYDGIKEFDNPLPTWWLMTFFATIIFSFIYFIHYNFGGAPTQLQELQADLDTLPKVNEKKWTEIELAGKIDLPHMIEKGLAVYSSKCSVCHGPQGQGVIGPNLTDSYWISGKGERNDIIHVVAKGVVEKGMPAWSEILTEDELMTVTGYIYSLKGTHPANPKAPQGIEVKN